MKEKGEKKKKTIEPENSLGKPAKKDQGEERVRLNGPSSVHLGRKKRALSIEKHEKGGERALHKERKRKFPGKCSSAQRKEKELKRGERAPKKKKKK